MDKTPTNPGIWNFGTLGNPNLVPDPIRPMPLPQFDCSEKKAEAKEFKPTGERSGR